MAVAVDLRDILSGFLSAAAINANNTLIEEGFADTLNRTSNAVDNAMEVNLDMGLNKVINLQDGLESKHAINYSQLVGYVGNLISEDTLVTDRVTQVESILQLKSLTPVKNAQASLSQVGREGIFVFDDSDLSTEVSFDVHNGIYAAPDSDSSGASGAWVRAFGGPVIATWFGTTGDGVEDDTDHIQAAIDYAIYFSNGPEVYIPAGSYRTTTTLHLGYGTTFESVVVKGAGSKYRGGDTSGTQIIADFNDEPAVNFQGSRISEIHSLSLIGANQDHLNSDFYGEGDDVPAADDTVAANWVDPTFPAASSSQYAPYAGISIDAYSGTAPGTAYPSVSYPSWLGGVAQYGKNMSSDVLINNVEVTGFVVGVVSQPSDVDGNGDFINVVNSTINNVQYGVSIGNSQSRNFKVDTVNMYKVFCAFTNRIHGRQIGKFNSPISNCSLDACINIVDIATNFSGPSTIDHLYCERTWRIGDVASTSANETSLNFDSCHFGLGSQNEERGFPGWCLGGAQQAVNIKFDSCYFTGFTTAISIQHEEARLVDCTVDPINRRNNVSDTYMRFFHNATCGGITVGFNLNPLYPSVIKYKQKELSTGDTSETVVAHEGFTKASRDYCMPLLIKSITPTNNNSVATMISNDRVGAISKGSLSALSLSDLTLSMTFSSRSERQFLSEGPDNGDVILDDNSGMLFVVTSRTGTAVTALALNNYKSDGGGGYDSDFSDSTGILYWGCNRFYTPTYFLQGDLTNASADITNCGRADGFAGFMEDDIGVGDYLYINEQVDRPASPNNMTITDVDDGTATITVNGTMSRDETRRRLDYFVRTPPANS